MYVLQVTYDCDTMHVFFEVFFSDFQVFRHCFLKVAIITIEQFNIGFCLVNCSGDFT